jgi:hypothetical protein
MIFEENNDNYYLFRYTFENGVTMHLLVDDVFESQKKLSGNDAYSFVKEQRPDVHTNFLTSSINGITFSYNGLKKNTYTVKRSYTETPIGNPFIEVSFDLSAGQFDNFLIDFVSGMYDKMKYESK